jgi:spore germination protein KA
LRKLLRRLKFWASLRGKVEQTGDHDPVLPKEFGGDLDRNLEAIRTLLGNSTDLIIREFNFGSQSQFQVALVFVDGLVNKNQINESIVRPLIYDTHLIENRALQENDLEFIWRSLLAMGDVDKKMDSMGLFPRYYLETSFFF